MSKQWLIHQVRVVVGIITVGGLGIGLYWQKRENAPVNRIKTQLNFAKLAERSSETSIFHTTQALEIMNGINPEDSHVYELCFCIASQYERRRDWIQAQRYYTKALDSINNTSFEAVFRRMVALSRLANTYHETKQLVKSENLYRKALETYEKQSKTQWTVAQKDRIHAELTAVLYNYAAVATERQDTVQARGLLQHALKMSERSTLVEETKRKRLRELLVSSE